MKKLLLALILILLLSCIGLVIFIPAQLEVSQLTNIGCMVNGANRALQDENKWQRWWPKNAKEGNNSLNEYHYNGYNYAVIKKLYNRFEVQTKASEKSYTGTITLLPFSNDSVHVLWNYVIPTSANPFNKISEYWKARKFRKNAEAILSSLKQFLEKTENVYGIKISSTSTDKIYLAATTSIFPRYPDPADIYQMIEKLRDEISRQQLRETGRPMINNTALDSTRFETMVAIPVDTIIHETKDINMRRIVTIKALVATVKGGPGKIQEALAQLNQYAIDHKLFSPAIPYETIVTERWKEPDTSKWVTTIYQPLL